MPSKLLKQDWKAFLEFYNNLKIGQTVWIINGKNEVDKTTILAKSHNNTVDITNYYNCSVDLHIEVEPDYNKIGYSIEQHDLYLTEEEAYTALSEQK